MKNKTLILVFLVFVLRLQSQTYFPFPDSNAVWSVGKQKFILKGDSLYNTKLYGKIFLKKDTTLYSDSLHYLGLIRQDKPAKKVFGIAKNKTAEALMYNFGLVLNDTVTVFPFQNPYNIPKFHLKVMQVDSTLVGNLYHRSLYVAGHPQGSAIELWIEGVGGMIAIINPGTLAYDGIGSTDYTPCHEQLLCLKVNGLIGYDNPSFSTCFEQTTFTPAQPCISGIHKQSAFRNLNLFPNPVGDKLMLNFDPLANNLRYEMYLTDLLGRTILIHTLDQHNEFSLQNLQAGVFLLQIMGDKQLLYTQKIIKE